MFLEIGKGRGKGRGKGIGAGDWRWRGVVLEGGVAGGVPPHKGGPQARPPKKQERGVRSEKRLRLTVAELL